MTTIKKAMDLKERARRGREYAVERGMSTAEALRALLDKASEESNSPSSATPGGFLYADGTLICDANGNPVKQGVVYEGESRGLLFTCVPKIKNHRLVPEPVGEFSNQYSHMLYRWSWEEAKPIDPE
jgi:hypothetical protein